MKRVLIITYYWPPGGGGGVMRWLKMSKYLDSNTQWEPVIFCPDYPNYLISDDSLLEQIPDKVEVLRHPILEPNDFLRKLGFSNTLKNVAAGGIGKIKKKSSLKNKLIIWIRSNLFIPDARAFWVKPAAKRIIKDFKALNIDAIISTGPPHSMHLIAKKVTEKYNIPWIADFRDPWTFIDFFEDLDLTNRSRKKHLRLEKEVLERANKVVTVSRSWAKQFEKLYNVEIDVITNGYDPNDFIDSILPNKDGKFRICHIGSLNKDRNAPEFWNAVSDLISNNSNFKENLKIEIIGTVADDLNRIILENGLEDNVEIIGYMPHADVLKRLRLSNVSLLLINNTSNKEGIIPGKLYEYLAARNPILCIGNTTGDSANIIKECKAGVTVDFQNKDRIMSLLEDYYLKFKKGNLALTNEDNIKKYSRQALAKEYASILDEILNKR